jgi:hypothetical protein
MKIIMDANKNNTTVLPSQLGLTADRGVQKYEKVILNY